MKAKERIPETCEQPKALPAPPNEQTKDELAPWQKVIVALAEARLSVDDERDVILEMHRRAIALSVIVQEAAESGSPSELPLDALSKVMQVIEEEIQVAKWLAAGRPLDPRWY